MPLHVRLTVFLLLALVVVACDATGVDGSPAPGSSADSANATIGPPGAECIALPTINRDQEDPAVPLTPDAVLERKFPATIDGQPLQDLASGRWHELECLLSGQQAYDATRASVNGSIDLGSLTVASAQATIDGLPVSITAFRTPGEDAPALLDALGALSGSISDSPRFADSPQPASVAGKQVSLWPLDQVRSSYAYVSGDTLFVVAGATDSQAGKIFSALP
jgi:hypothetical protein